MCIKIGNVSVFGHIDYDFNCSWCNVASCVRFVICCSWRIYGCWSCAFHKLLGCLVYVISRWNTYAGWVFEEKDWFWIFALLTLIGSIEYIRCFNGTLSDVIFLYNIKPNKQIGLFGEIAINPILSIHIGDVEVVRKVDRL